MKPNYIQVYAVIFGRTYKTKTQSSLGTLSLKSTLWQFVLNVSRHSKWSRDISRNIVSLFSFWKDEELKNDGRSSRTESSQPYQSLSDHSDEVRLRSPEVHYLCCKCFRASRQVRERWRVFTGTWWARRSPRREKEDHPAVLIGRKRQDRKTERRPKGQEGRRTRRRRPEITELSITLQAFWFMNKLVLYVLFFFLFFFQL